MSMITSCKNGHYYDRSRYTKGCPYCDSENTFSGETVFAAAEPIPGVAAPPCPSAPLDATVLLTEPLLGIAHPSAPNVSATGQTKTIIPSQAEDAVTQQEITLQNVMRCPNGHVYNGNRFPDGCPYCEPDIPAEVPAEVQAEVPENTPVEKPAPAVQSSPKFVYGWLADIRSESRGNIYALGSENYVVCGADVRILPEKDGAADGFALLYDPGAGAFYVCMEDGVLINHRTPVSKFTYLRYHDTLTYGKNAFVFVPLCDREFGW